ncbi:electron transfer flavoprotein subunit alpha/FixB family protein [Halorubrum halodurans]|jgi:electron transfer flavoprotein alpha subunit|uniref:Electron transfer flavoprotein subunit alpha n=1 Tax=Halorubrum halodurans TaxID=1383851 RepID=A0A256IB29_9EURY|nr:electron transfer flavoprotein subunit alpha/FixB family protein [Halorubrum halodurans]OYR53750.1 electron transfer flavoprotein subunit alpha [Halorubrum halodurans]
MSDVLVVSEHRRGELRDVSLELLTAGRELADALGGDLHVAVVAGDVDRFADELNRPGVDRIHAVENGEEFDHTVYAAAVETLVGEVDPTAVLAPNSVNGLDYAPAVAERLALPLVTDVLGFEYDADDGLTVTREMYGSKVETSVAVDGDRFCLTVRGGEFVPAEGVGDAEVASVDVEAPASGARVKGFEEVGGGDVDIADADVLVSVGRGIGEEENLELVEELADALDATLSSSRPIVDNGWLPKNRQVGQSGKVVTPDVYLAVGISGAVQHVAGMKGSETIVAINTDPNAPIFDIADYGIVGDLFDVVPELIAEFE